MLTKIAPIGTARVFLPIRDLHRRNLARLVGARNYGYVHSAAEILQQARFLTGEINSIPENLYPMIATADPKLPRLAAVPRQPDVYLIEISSRNALKEPSGWYLQSHLARGQKHGAEVISIHNAALKDYMKQISVLLGAGRVCFVTPIDAAAADGNTFPARSALIDAIIEIAGELGVPVILPTELLTLIAQQDLLDLNGASLYRYSDDATEIVADFYLQKLQKLGWDKVVAA